MKKDKYIMISTPIHINHIQFELTDEIKDSLFITQDKSIVAFKSGYLNDVDGKSLTLSMLGYKDSKDIPQKIKDEDSLKKILYCIQE